MGRWGNDARARLAQAALNLYQERGYEQTTVAEIAAKANLTERTFFRHFADKREVLFIGTAALQQLIVETVSSAPAQTPSFEAVTAAFAAAGQFFEGNLAHSQRRQAVIDAHPELQARELHKLATLGLAVQDALRRRGDTERTAELCAETGSLIFKMTFGRWVRQTEPRDWTALLQEVLSELRSVLVPPERSPSPKRR